MGLEFDIPDIYIDNDGAIKLVTAGMGQKRARHLPIKKHYVFELCRGGKIKVNRIAGSIQHADPLMKGSRTVKQHNYLRELMGINDAAKRTFGPALGGGLM